MDKRYSLPGSLSTPLIKKYQDYHCFARKKPTKFGCKRLFTIIVIILVGILTAKMIEIIHSKYQELVNDIHKLQISLAEKEINLQKMKEIQKNETFLIQKQLDNLINALSIYAEKKTDLDEEKAKLSINLEENISLLKKDLVYHLQYYLNSFYENVFLQELGKEQNKMETSLLEIEKKIINFANDLRSFEEKFNIINIADLIYGAKIIKYDEKNITFTTSSFIFATSLLHYFDKFSNVDILISSTNDFTKCYQANGSHGKITIQLKKRTKIFAFSYEHRLDGNNDKNAIQFFEIYGFLNEMLNDPIDSFNESLKNYGYFLGAYYFTAAKITKNIVGKNNFQESFWKFNEGNRFKQYFICSHHNCKENTYKTIRIEYNNWGEKSYTCLYKFEIFAKLTET